jgi:two-component system heavy metal sensor histidine kinase CusS
MNFFKSIRFRLALWSAIITGVIVLAFSTLSAFLMYHSYLDTIDNEMEQFGEDLVEELDDEGRYNQKELVDFFDLFDDRKSLHLIAVVSPNDETIFQSSHWKGHTLELDKERSSYHQTIRHDEKDWRYARVKENRWQIFVGSRLDEVSEIQEKILGAFAIAFPLATLLAAMGGLILAHRAMKPVKLIARTARDINAQGLGKRIGEGHLIDDELGQLTTVLNSMLSRLEKSFNQAARFSADASHELNTPLAIMQGELETALQRETISESEEHLLSNLVEETQRLKTITRSLLLFSQSDAGNLKLESKPFDLSSTIQALLEDAQSLDAANDLSFKIDLEKRIIAHGDQTLLRQAIHNLLTNAVRYNHSNGVVGISLHKKPGLLTIRVSNTGPGISPTNQNKVFDRFFRADFSRTRKHESFGLGLPLAREIAKAHGGNIVLVASNSEKTTFEFKLPTDKLK